MELVPRLASQDSADKLELLKATDDFSGRRVGKDEAAGAADATRVQSETPVEP